MTGGLPVGANEDEQRAMWDALTVDEKLGASVTLALQALRAERDEARNGTAVVEVEMYAARRHLRNVLDVLARAGWSPSWAHENDTLTAAREYANGDPTEVPTDPEPEHGAVSER